MDIEKVKKLIAKEVLLAFGIVVAVAASWGVLLLRNEYYKYCEKSLNTVIIELSRNLDTLPENKIKALYEGINSDFVVNYKAGEEEYAIPKKEEQEFIKEFAQNPIYKYLKENKLTELTESQFLKKYSNKTEAKKIYDFYVINDLTKLNEKDFIDRYFINYRTPPLTILSTKPLGYSYFHIEKDSVLVFDFVPLEKFRELIQINEYRYNLYQTFSKSFDLGDTNQFEQKIREGLRFNIFTNTYKKKLEKEKSQKQETLLYTTSSIWDNNKIKTVFQYIFIVLIILAYPVRICYFLLKWALKTLRT